jgi:hypothetical protein
MILKTITTCCSCEYYCALLLTLLVASCGTGTEEGEQRRPEVDHLTLGGKMDLPSWIEAKQTPIECSKSIQDAFSGFQSFHAYPLEAAEGTIYTLKLEGEFPLYKGAGISVFDAQTGTRLAREQVWWGNEVTLEFMPPKSGPYLVAVYSIVWWCNGKYTLGAACKPAVGVKTTRSLYRYPSSRGEAVQALLTNGRSQSLFVSLCDVTVEKKGPNGWEPPPSGLACPPVPLGEVEPGGTALMTPFGSGPGAQGPGTYRVVVSYHLGCNAGAPVAQAGCASTHQVASGAFELKECPILTGQSPSGCAGVPVGTVDADGCLTGEACLPDKASLKLVAPLYSVDAHIKDLWGSSSGELWAVGGAQLPPDLGGGKLSTILSFDGKSWSSIPTGTASPLNAIWGSSPSDLFAVGDNGAIVHYDGLAWSAMTSGTTAALNAVFGTSSKNVYAVGGTLPTAYPAPGPTHALLHYDGKAWSKVDLPPSAVFALSGRLSGVWGSGADDIWVVGFFGGMLHFDGTQWAIVPSGTTFALASVWGTAKDDVWAVAGGAWGVSSLLHYDGKGWSHLPFQTGMRPLQRVRPVAANDVWVAGPNAVLRFDGGSWSSVAIPATTPPDMLVGLHPLPSNEVYLVGMGASLYSGTGFVP